ncbi:hypothetical protein [Campylobacter fetus]|uniref:hypothetical protein n=1 Tax=Campylobacter fetus TaxID=196 RepID=UPI000FCAB587|nr:hypothetical protein [Campylobacter fetus]QQF52237.1 NAD-glutamate dehydrogenase [Campylobacter fetus subsp. venerealis]RUT50463.1 hypothetical protein BWK67_04545 [Campylobacter fetus]RUT50780.1 hypothetical protein BWK51_04525 [Campylobacter fetus]
MNMLFRFLGSDNIAFRELFFTDAKIDIEVIRDDESGFVAQKAIYDCNKKNSDTSGNYVENCELVFVPVYTQKIRVKIQGCIEQSFNFEVILPFDSTHFKILAKYSSEYRAIEPASQDNDEGYYISLFEIIQNLMKSSRLIINYWSGEFEGSEISGQKLHIMTDSNNIYLN